MRFERFTICVAVLVFIVLAFLFERMVRIQEKFAVGLVWTGRTTHGYSLLSVSLTNQSKVPVLFDGLEYQWTSKSGHILGSHAVQPGSWRHSVPVSGVVTTLIAVPEE